MKKQILIFLLLSFFAVNCQGGIFEKFGITFGGKKAKTKTGDIITKEGFSGTDIGIVFGVVGGVCSILFGIYKLPSGKYRKLAKDYEHLRIAITLVAVKHPEAAKQIIFEADTIKRGSRLE